MRGATRNLSYAKLSHPGGGIVQCSECGAVVGKIEKFNYQYIKYIFVCKCGNVGKAELYRGKKPWLEYPKRPLYNKENHFMCQTCETPLFYVEIDAVDNFGFDVICKCGIEYDVKFKNKWEDAESFFDSGLAGGKK